MKRRKEYLHWLIKTHKKIKAGIRTDQKTPRLNYTIGKAHRFIKNRNPKTYRAKAIIRTMRLCIYLREKKVTQE